MPRPCAGKQSVGRCEAEKPNGSIYVYERTAQYDRDTKKRSKFKLLGIKKPETGGVRNTRPRKKKTETSTCGEYFERKETTILSNGKKSCKIGLRSKNYSKCCLH